MKAISGALKLIDLTRWHGLVHPCKLLASLPCECHGLGAGALFLLAGLFQVLRCERGLGRHGRQVEAGGPRK